MSIRPFAVGWAWPLCAKMTSSTKPEVLNVFKRQMRSGRCHGIKLQAPKIGQSLDVWFRKYATGETRQTDRHTRRNTPLCWRSNKCVLSLVDSAVNTTLPAFAAERRAAAPLLLGARHRPLSTDISCLPGAQQQTRRTRPCCDRMTGHTSGVARNFRQGVCQSVEFLSVHSRSAALPIRPYNQKTS